MGSDVYMIEKDIHHHTLLLLHTCKWAIFDVNVPAGQLMEIERTLDYVLVVYKISESASTHISFMIKTYTNPRIKFEGYRDLEELKNLIIRYLPKYLGTHCGLYSVVGCVFFARGVTIFIFFAASFV
jgi:hypothetical protein